MKEINCHLKENKFNLQNKKIIGAWMNIHNLSFDIGKFLAFLY
jgi:hypothetical protein